MARSPVRIAQLLLAGCLAACSSTPPSHYTLLWPEGRTGEPIVGLSTQGGVLMLTSPTFAVGDLFELQFPVGNSVVWDWARLDQMNDDLTIARPITARLMQGRLASELPRRGEQLYLAMRNQQDKPVMMPLESWYEGRLGDYVHLPGENADEVARQYAGAGLYVERNSRWTIVGILSGLTARVDGASSGKVGLGYIGLTEIARILPDEVNYFDKDVRPLRPDFEFGVPLQPGDIDLDDLGDEDISPAFPGRS